MASPYDMLRQNVKGDTEKLREAAKRRIEQQLAANQGLSSGRAFKLQGQAERDIAEQESKALNEIGFQEASTKSSQDFARGEREGSQDFQKQQSALDRVLQERSVALAEKNFAEQTNQFNREFDVNVRNNLFNKLISISQADIGALKSKIDQIKGGTVQALGFTPEDIYNIEGGGTIARQIAPTSTVSRVNSPYVNTGGRYPI